MAPSPLRARSPMKNTSNVLEDATNKENQPAVQSDASAAATGKEVVGKMENAAEQSNAPAATANSALQDTTPEPTKAKKRAGRPKGSLNKPKPAIVAAAQQTAENNGQQRRRSSIRIQQRAEKAEASNINESTQAAATNTPPPKRKLSETDIVDGSQFTKRAKGKVTETPSAPASVRSRNFPPQTPKKAASSQQKKGNWQETGAATGNTLDEMREPPFSLFWNRNPENMQDEIELIVAMKKRLGKN